MSKMTTQTKTTWRKEDIQERLDCALKLLIRNDSALFKNRANERSLTHMLASYLAEQFSEYHIDCEYNRMWQDGVEREKGITVEDMPFEVSTEDVEAVNVFPDIIVHRRENSENNLLIIEAKKSSNNNRRADFQKLNGFMRDIGDGGRGYEFSAFVVFDVTNPENSTSEIKDRNETWNYE